MAEKLIPVQPEVPPEQEADFDRLTEFMNPVQARWALGIEAVSHEVAAPPEVTPTSNTSRLASKPERTYKKPLNGWQNHLAESLPDDQWKVR